MYPWRAPQRILFRHLPNQGRAYLVRQAVARCADNSSMSRTGEIPCDARR
jgi:hypothetical protein